MLNVVQKCCALCGTVCSSGPPAAEPQLLEEGGVCSPRTARAGDGAAGRGSRMVQAGSSSRCSLGPAAAEAALCAVQALQQLRRRVDLADSCRIFTQLVGW
jgi:hypothetical protein